MRQSPAQRHRSCSFPGNVKVHGFCSAKESFSTQLNVFNPACGTSRPWLMHPEWLTTLYRADEKRAGIHPSPLCCAHFHCSKEEVTPSFSPHKHPVPLVSPSALCQVPGMAHEALLLYFSLFPPKAPCNSACWAEQATTPLPRALENRWQAQVFPDKQRNQN